MKSGKRRRRETSVCAGRAYRSPFPASLTRRRLRGRGSGSPLRLTDELSGKHIRLANTFLAEDRWGYSMLGVYTPKKAGRK